MKPSDERRTLAIAESLVAGIAAYTAAEVYDRWFSAKTNGPEHSAKAGASLVHTKASALNPITLGIGIGLMAHDFKDAPEQLKQQGGMPA